MFGNIVYNGLYGYITCALYGFVIGGLSAHFIESPIKGFFVSQFSVYFSFLLHNKYIIYIDNKTRNTIQNILNKLGNRLELSEQDIKDIKYYEKYVYILYIVYRKEYYILNKLLEYGINPNIDREYCIWTPNNKITYKSTYLNHICEVDIKDIKAIKLLLKYGANYNIKDSKCYNALMYSIKNNNILYTRLFKRMIIVYILHNL